MIIAFIVGVAVGLVAYDIYNQHMIKTFWSK